MRPMLLLICFCVLFSLGTPQNRGFSLSAGNTTVRSNPRPLIRGSDSESARSSMENVFGNNIRPLIRKSEDTNNMKPLPRPMVREQTIQHEDTILPTNSLVAFIICLFATK